LQQAATAMLAQANQMPNVILSLLKWCLKDFSF
jgi:flagellin-like hook-associated protein FlgL